MSTETAKTANFFSGYDSYGSSIEVCIRKEDGQMFWRWFRGNHIGWSKWAKMDNTPVYFRNGEPKISWGFNELNGIYYKGVRPPKIKEEKPLLLVKKAV